jgi:hypothetical protein
VSVAVDDAVLTSPAPLAVLRAQQLVRRPEIVRRSARRRRLPKQTQTASRAPRPMTTSRPISRTPTAPMRALWIPRAGCSVCKRRQARRRSASSARRAAKPCSPTTSTAHPTAAPTTWWSARRARCTSRSPDPTYCRYEAAVPVATACRVPRAPGWRGAAYRRRHPAPERHHAQLDEATLSVNDTLGRRSSASTCSADGSVANRRGSPPTMT